MNNKLNLNEFLQQIEEGNLRKIEAFIYVETITDNFKPEKLRLLLEDINDAFDGRKNHHREYWENLLNIKPKYDEQGKKIPRLKRQNGKVFDLHEEIDFFVMVLTYNLQTLKDIVVAKLDEYRIEESAYIAHPIDPVREIGIEQYLNDEGQKHFNKIKQLYQNVKSKKDYVSMLFALGELGLLSVNPLNVGKSSYHRALQVTFGITSVGGRANVNHFFSALSEPFAKDQITRHRLLIQKAIS